MLSRPIRLWPKPPPPNPPKPPPNPPRPPWPPCPRWPPWPRCPCCCARADRAMPITAIAATVNTSLNRITFSLTQDEQFADRRRLTRQERRRTDWPAGRLNPPAAARFRCLRLRTSPYPAVANAQHDDIRTITQITNPPVSRGAPCQNEKEASPP